MLLERQLCTRIQTGLNIKTEIGNLFKTIFVYNVHYARLYSLNGVFVRLLHAP